MATQHQFWSRQPPGACPPGPLARTLFPELRLLWNAPVWKRDIVTGQNGDWTGISGSLSLPPTVDGIGLALPDGIAGAALSFSSRPTGTQPKITLFGALHTKTTSGAIQIVVATSFISGGGHSMKLDSSGTTLTASKPGVADSGSLTLDVNTPYVWIYSHDEATDAYWLMARNLLNGKTVSTSGTDTTTASASGGTYLIGGQDDGTRPCTSPIMMIGIAENFVPQAVGYAFLDTPWHMFARAPTRKTVASGTTYNVDLTETASLTDADAATLTAAAAVTETASLTDAVTSLLSAIAAVTETASLTDSQAATGALLASVSETASLSDAIAAVLAIGAAVSESTSVSDVVASVLAAVAAVTETASLSETVSWSGAAYSAGVSESVSPADALTSALQLLALVTESATPVDGVSAAGSTYRVTLTEAAALLESLLAVGGSARANSAAPIGHGLTLSRRQAIATGRRLSIITRTR